MKCNLCRESCIADSINNDNSLEIDWNKCIRCGICSGICPTEVFIIQKPSDSMILDIILSSKKEDIISISCNYVDGRFSKILKQSYSNNEIVVPCTGRFSEIFLFILMLIGSNKIRINDCNKDCEFREGVNRLERIRKNTNNLSRLLNEYNNMDLLYSKSPIIYSKRRELLFETIRASFQTILKQDVDGNNNSKQNISFPNRRRLLEIIKIVKPVDKLVNCNDLPFGEIQVDIERCNVNGECTLKCPTGSLHLISDNLSQELNFSAGYCIGCGYCVEACPNGSLKLNKTIDLASLSTARRTILERKFKLCESCGNQFSSKIEDSVLCSDCISRWSAIERYSSEV